MIPVPSSLNSMIQQLQDISDSACLPVRHIADDQNVVLSLKTSTDSTCVKAFGTEHDWRQVSVVFGVLRFFFVGCFVRILTTIWRRRPSMLSNLFAKRGCGVHDSFPSICVL